jgi:uncharacterized OB-fold protein
MPNPRPIPRLDADNRAFWTGGAEGELRICHCRDCDTWIHPPQPVCRNCLSENVHPEAVPGTGVVDTFTINYQAWGPGMEVPFVLARVALDGAPGVILTTNIIGAPVDEVEFGDRVRVTFEQHEDVWIPLFEKVA